MKRTHSAVAIALIVHATTLDAQACLGLPERGAITGGIEGIDAAAGFGAAVRLNKARGFAQLQYESLSHFTIIDPLQTARITFGRRITRGGLATCVVAGAAATFYETEYFISSSRSASDPDHVYEQHGVGMTYRRFRAPLGVAVGKDVALFRHVLVTPFIVQSVVAEYEGADETVRRTIGSSTRGGLSLSLGRFLLHSELARTRTTDRQLSRASDGLSISFHAGVRL